MLISLLQRLISKPQMTGLLVQVQLHKVRIHLGRWCSAMQDEQHEADHIRIQTVHLKDKYVINVYFME
jgi:hypothetical protein